MDTLHHKYFNFLRSNVRCVFIKTSGKYNLNIGTIFIKQIYIKLLFVLKGNTSPLINVVNASSSVNGEKWVILYGEFLGV